MRCYVAYAPLALLILATTVSAEGNKKRIGVRVTELEARVSEIEKKVSQLAARLQAIEDELASVAAVPGKPVPGQPDATQVQLEEEVVQPKTAVQQAADVKEMTPGEARLQAKLAEYWKNWPPKELRKKQKKRWRFINDRQSEGYWKAVACDGKTMTVLVEDKFLLLDQKTRNQLLGVIYDFWSEKDDSIKELSKRQENRRRFINDRQSEGYWKAVEFDGTTLTVWVEDEFLLLNQKTQNQFLGVIYAFWSEKDDSFGGEGVIWDPLIVRKDIGVAVSRPFGTYTPYDGLR